MPHDDMKNNHIVILLILFWFIWGYTEVSEYYGRRENLAEVYAFIGQGDRFTKEDGVALEARLAALEKRIRASDSPGDCE